MSGSDPDLVEVAIKAGVNAVAPGVGSLLCFAARKALDKDAEERLEQHLSEAMRLGSSGPKLPRRAVIQRTKRFFQLKSASKRAGKEMELLGNLVPVRHDLADPPVGKEDGPPAVVDLLIPGLVGTVSRRLADAINRSDVTTWTANMTDMLASRASDCLGGSDPVEARRWAQIVLGKGDADIKEGRTVDLLAWASAVTLRFEIALIQDDGMKAWVARLDHHDATAGQNEMLRAVRSVEVALLTIAGVSLAFAGVLGIEQL